MGWEREDAVEYLKVKTKLLRLIKNIISIIIPCFSRSTTAT